MELNTYLDNLLAEKQEYTRLRRELSNQIDQLLVAFWASTQVVSEEEDKQADFMDRIQILRQKINDYNYHENQLDSQIQAARDVIVGMSGGA